MNAYWKQKLRVMNPFGARLITETGERFNVADFATRIDRAMTSFDELTVSEVSSQIDLKSTYPISKLRDKITVSNGGAVTKANAEFKISTTDNGDSSALFQSLERGRYKAGFEAVCGIAIRIPVRPTGDQVIEWGYTDFQNGFVIGEDAIGMYSAIYSNGVKTRIRRRSAWINPMTGDPFTIDLTRINIFNMRFRWYGRGPYYFRILGEDALGQGRIFFVDSTTIGDTVGPINLDPNQNISVRVENNGTTTPLDVFVAGRHYGILGKDDPDQRITSNMVLLKSVGTTFIPIISVRQKSSSYTTISNKLQGIDIITASQDLVFQVRTFCLLTGASFAAPTFSEAGVETSLEFDTTASAFAESGEGIKIFEGLLASGSGNNAAGIPFNLPNQELPGEGIITTLCARSISSTATVSCVFKIKEEW